MVSNLLFIVQFIAFFVFGLLWQFKLKHIMFSTVVLIGVLLPYTPSLQSLYYRSGLSVFDAFIFGAAIGFLIYRAKHKSFALGKDNIVIFSSLFFLVSVFSLLSLLKVNINVVHFLKDLKPLIIITTSYLLWSTVCDRSYQSYSLNIKAVSSFVLVKNSIFFVLFYFIGMSFFYTGDVYIDTAESAVRYADYANLFFILLSLKMLLSIPECSNSNFYRSYNFKLLLVIGVSITISLLSGSRTFLLINLFVIGFWLCRFRLFYVVMLLLSVMLFVLVYSTETNFNLGRFSDIFSFERLGVLLYNRFYPVISLYEQGLSIQQFLFGHGVGTSFYIPWLEGVGDLSPVQAYIDNFLLTLFAKFGIIGVLLTLVIFSVIFFSLSKSLLQFVIFFTVFILLTLTTSFWYQINFTYLVISFIYLFSDNYYNNVNEKS